MNCRDRTWSEFLVTNKNFFAYPFVLVTLAFQLDVVAVFIIPMERELRGVVQGKEINYHTPYFLQMTFF
jgi:hypothetical protein